MPLPTTTDPEKLMEIALRREQVARLYAEGVSRARITQQLTVSVATVARDLQFIAKLWQRLLDRDLTR